MRCGSLPAARAARCLLRQRSQLTAAQVGWVVVVGVRLLTPGSNPGSFSSLGQARPRASSTVPRVDPEHGRSAACARRAGAASVCEPESPPPAAAIPSRRPGPAATRAFKFSDPDTRGPGEPGTAPPLPARLSCQHSPAAAVPAATSRPARPILSLAGLDPGGLPGAPGQAEPPGVTRRRARPG